METHGIVSGMSPQRLRGRHNIVFGAKSEIKIEPLKLHFAIYLNDISIYSTFILISRESDQLPHYDKSSILAVYKK